MFENSFEHLDASSLPSYYNTSSRLSNVHLLRDTDDIYIVIKAKDINM